MNKTVNINLGGFFFHIDEEAYNKLKKYLDAVRISLNDDPKGKDEIINDIEIRISEILFERIKSDRQVVNLNDVDYIIEIMGKPEDYTVDDSFFDESFNDINKNRKKKKLYRDPDDKFFGGVCSGIAHYFGIDPVWVRLFWIFLAITFGSGILIYLLLWVLLPAANTTSQKLEMQGEVVNISNIERKIKEELNDVSNKFKEGVEGFSNDLKDVKFQSRLKTGLQEIVTLISKVFKSIFKLSGKFIGVVLVFISGVILLSILVSIFSIGSIEFLGVSSDIVHYPPFFYDASIPKGVLGIALTLLVGIPFIFLFSLGLKIISSNVKSIPSVAKLSLLGLWLISLMMIIFSAIESNLKYANSATISINKTLNNSKNDIIYVSFRGKEDIGLYRNQQRVIIDDEIEKLLETDVKIKIESTNSDKPKLIVYKKAKGLTVKKAKEKAEDIEYNFTFNDDKLILDSYFITDIKNKLNNNEVEIVLFLPLNKIVKLDYSVKNFIRKSNFEDDNFSFKTNNLVFKMTNDGLRCVSCNKQTTSLRNDKTAIKDKIIKKERVTIDENGVKVR
jgi:phage shock protein PspC (stress-responsive transcriptional regulator)